MTELLNGAHAKPADARVARTVRVLGVDPVEPENTVPTAVGVVDVEAPADVHYPIREPQRYHDRVRLMVRQGGRPLGFGEIDTYGTTPGTAAVAAVISEVVAAASSSAGSPSAGSPSTASAPAVTDVVPVSVIVCTRDREDQLRRCLVSVLAQIAADDEVVVVDNAPKTGATRAVVDELADPRLHYVLEPRPGLSVARNRGMREARHEICAFTDDDVVADRLWLRHVRATLALPTAASVSSKAGSSIAQSSMAQRSIGCVTGLVPSAELESRWQHYFERRIAWGSQLEPQLFHAGDDRGPLYPFSAGIFGTGANLTITQSTFRAVGPFDEGLGAGRTTRGGEDLDYFLRIIRAGIAIAYEPAAVIWHVHRPDEDSFREQVTGYGVGFGAYAAKVLLNPRTAWALLRRLPKGVRKLRSETDRAQEQGGLPQEFVTLEWQGMLRGPVALLRERFGAVRRRGVSA